MHMELSDVVEKLHIAAAGEVLAPSWDESEATLPDAPAFLQPEAVSYHREFAGLGPGDDAVLQDVAARVRATPALLHLAWHCHRLLYLSPDYPGSSIARWPSLERTLGDEWGAFYLLVNMSMVPLTLAAQQARGIPEQVTRDTCGKMAEIVAYHRRAHGGHLGADLRILYWTRLYASGDLCTLGRMEYMIRPFGGRLRAYRNRETHEVVALSEDPMRFAADGFMCFEGAAGAGRGEGWTSRLVVTEGSVTGTPIHPAGYGLRTEVTLPLRDWEQVLAPGDPMLDTHIPGGGGMTPERCRDTMERALEFFPKHFPDQPFVGFACMSWILNPELETILPENPNMVLWQRELYLFPIPTGRTSGLLFLFGTDELDFASLPRDTTMRRRVLEHLEGGGRLICGGEFFLKDDFSQYSSQFYRKHWPPRGVEGLATP
jgi:hypothetical protein